MKKEFLKSIKYLAFAFTIALGVGYVFAGSWTPPPSTPPNNNVDAPVNVGTTDQVKIGGLSVNGAFKLPSIGIAGQQTLLCAEADGTVDKCAPDNIIPIEYITQENSDLPNVSYPGVPYQWIDNNLQFFVDGNNVYNEYYDTSGLFTLAHDGDMVTVSDNSQYPVPPGAAIVIKVQEDGATIPGGCIIDSNNTNQTIYPNSSGVSIPGHSITFQAHAGNQYFVSTNSTDGPQSLFANTSSGSLQWASGCS